MKLNIGSSSCHLDGWINLEYDQSYWIRHTFSGERISSKATRNMPDVFGDASNLQYGENTFDELRSSHVLEHIPQTKTIATIKEWHRVLKTGGCCRIIVPDISFYIEKWVNKESNKEWWDVHLNDLGLYCDSERKAPFINIDDAFIHLIFLNGHHFTAFTPDLLKHYMESVGFKNITNCNEDEEDIPDCTVCDFSLRLKGFK